LRDVVVGRDEENEAGIVTYSRIPDPWLKRQSVSVAARFALRRVGHVIARRKLFQIPYFPYYFHH
jgi:hypothetical protein